MTTSLIRGEVIIENERLVNSAGIKNSEIRLCQRKNAKQPQVSLCC